MSEKQKLFLATGNAHKVEEVSRFLAEQDLDLVVLSASELGGMPEVEETEDTFSGNALLKAEALLALAQPGDWVLADDSGIEVDALDGRPGVFSARYAGENATSEENNSKLIQELAGVVGPERSARYVCALVLLGAGPEAYIVEETCEGVLTEKPSGENGFGYDPYFIPEGYTETFGILSPQIKDGISHRAKALSMLVEHMRGD